MFDLDLFERYIDVAIVNGVVGGEMDFLASFRTKCDNIPVLRRFVELPNVSNTLRFWASNSIKELTNIYGSSWGVEYSIDQFLWICSVMIENYDFIDEKSQFQLSNALGIIAAFHWEFCQEDFFNSVQGVFLIKEYCIKQWESGLILLHGLISGVFLSTNSPLRELFCTRVLYPSLIFSLEIIQQASIIKANEEYQEVILKATQVCFDCISFPKLPTSTFKSFNDYTYLPHTSIFKLIFDHNFIQTLLTLYLSNPRFIDAAKCILYVGCIGDNYFSLIKQPLKKEEIFVNIIEVVFSQLEMKISSQQELLPFDESHYIMNLLCVFSRKLKSGIMNELASFYHLIESLNSYLIRFYDFNNVTIERKHNVFEHVDYFFIEPMSSWNIMLINAISEKNNNQLLNLLKEYVPELSNRYLIFLLQAAREITGNYDLVWNSTLSNTVMVFKYLIFADPNSITSSMLNVFNDLMYQSQTIHNTESLVPIQRQLSILVQVFTIVLLNPIQPREPSTTWYHPSLFVSMIQLIKKSYDWLSHEKLLEQLEISILHFLARFSDTVMYKNSSIRATLYNKVAQIDSSILDVQQVSEVIGSRFLLSLKFFGNFPNVISLAVENFSKIPITQVFLEEIFNSLYDDSFSFMNIESNKKYRSLLYGTLFNIVTEDDKVIWFSSMMKCFETRFHTMTYISDIVLLCRDLRSLFNEAKRKHQYDLLFEWFFPDKAQTLIGLFLQLSGTFSEFNVVLKLLGSISTSEPKGRIEFSPYSPNGVLMFQKCIGVIYYVINQLTSSEFSDQYIEENINTIKNCIQIVQNLLEGSYIVFDAFEIYGDPVFHEMLAIFTLLFSKLSLKSIHEYPSLHTDIIRFFRDLCHNHFKTMINSQPQLIGMILEALSYSLRYSQGVARVFSYETISYIAQYMNDHPNRKSTNFVYESYLDYLSTLFFLLWQNVFNDEDQIVTISSALNKMLLLEASLYSEMKDKMLSILSPEKMVLFNEMCIDFETDMSLLGDLESTRFLQRLHNFRLFIKSCGLKISLVDLETQ